MTLGSVKPCLSCLSNREQRNEFFPVCFYVLNNFQCSILSLLPRTSPSPGQHQHQSGHARLGCWRNDRPKSLRTRQRFSFDSDCILEAQYLQVMASMVLCHSVRTEEWKKRTDMFSLACFFLCSVHMRGLGVGCMPSACRSHRTAYES